MTQVLPEVNNHFREDTLFERPSDSFDTQEIQERSPEEIFKTGLLAEINVFEGWVLRKVQDEVTAQIVKDGTGAVEEIDLESVGDVVVMTFANEKRIHLQSAQDLENKAIPLAAKRARPNGSANDYWKKDIKNLRSRSRIHLEIAHYIENIEYIDQEGLYRLSKSYAEKALEKAQEAAAAIRIQQEEDRELAAFRREQIQYMTAAAQELAA